MVTDEEREARKSELKSQIEALERQCDAIQQDAEAKCREIRDTAEYETYEIERQIRKLESQIRRINLLRPHGTPARYQSGCHCEACRDAISKYQRERAEARDEGDYRGAVSADPVRAHLEELKAAGLSLSLLSRLTHVDTYYLYKVRAGEKKKIRADFASAILKWTPEIVAGERKVRAKSAQLHLASLQEQGLGLGDIAQRSGVDCEKLEEVLTRQYIETRIERAILAVVPRSPGLYLPLET